MKRVQCMLWLVLLLTVATYSSAQTTDGFQLFMHYPLIGTADDKSGNHNSLELQNTRFAGDSGVWMSGIYIHDTIPGGSLLQTPELESLRKDSLMISVEIYVEAFDGKNHAIIVAGDGWRYLGCGYGPQGELFLIVNGLSFNVPNMELPTKRWQTIALSYTLGDSTAQLYVNGTSVLERKTELFAPDDDNQISNSHFGWGVAFGGYMRELKVWQPKSVTLSVDTPSSEGSENTNTLFSLYPNPSLGIISIKAQKEINNITLLDLHGRSLLTKDLQSTDYSLDLRWLPNGTYLIQGTSADGENLVQKIIIAE